MNTEYNDPNNKPVEDMTIQELRKTATSLAIKPSRDWDADDFRTAITSRRKGGNILNVNIDPNTGPAPGYARIKLQNSSSGQNFPVPVAINKYVCKVPRDVVVDVPIEVMQVLQNSTYPAKRTQTDLETGTMKATNSDEPAYPLQVLGMTPGVARYPNGLAKIRASGDTERYRLREKYREINGRWPRNKEFKEFKAEFDRQRAGFAAGLEEKDVNRQLAKRLVADENKPE